jgi:hypothetical protein
MMQARRTFILVAVAVFVVGAIGPLLVLALFRRPAAPAASAEAEAKFRETFGSTLTDELVVLLYKREYHRQDIIDYRVENRTDETLWFEDQSFGVRGFAYKENEGQWVEVDLGFAVSEPMAKPVQAGPPDVGDFYDLLIDRIDLPEDGKIRLVITGYTDLRFPALHETYVAYADVVVVD